MFAQNSILISVSYLDPDPHVFPVRIRKKCGSETLILMSPIDLASQKPIKRHCMP